MHLLLRRSAVAPSRPGQLVGFDPRDADLETEGEWAPSGIGLEFEGLESHGVGRFAIEDVNYG